MRDCKEVFALLSQYLDRELPAGTCEDLEKHIAECPPCVEFVETLRKTCALCKEVEMEDAPPPLSDEARRDLERAYRAMLAARRA